MERMIGGMLAAPKAPERSSTDDWKIDTRDSSSYDPSDKRLRSAKAR